MRRKTLLTAVLCMVLAVASQSVSSEFHSLTYVKAEGLDAGTSEVTTNPSGTDAPPETQPPSETPTEPPTSAPETQPPTESTPPEPTTSAPEPKPEPETSPPTPTEPSTPEPTPTTPAPETQPTEPVTSTPTESSTSSETAPTETPPSETEATESSQSETPGETVPTETAPTEAAPVAPPPAETAPTEAPTEETVTEEESGTESETEEISNEELIARQTIVIPPDIEKEFRFTRIEKRYAIVRNPEGAQIYEQKSEDARKVGTLDYYGYCYVLEDQDDGWYYIESGNVRGFVRDEDVVTDAVADRIVKIKGMEDLSAARLLVARTENEAFTHTHTTVQKVMASPDYALASGSVNIYEQKKESARVIGTMSENALCYILADADADWVFVESGDARGFVKRSDLATGSKVEAIVSETGEKNMQLAEVLVEPEENKACYYTLTSVQEASQAAKTREAMVSFAKQFLGNPYVWGGTSLTQGADCSGFVQSIYSYFGYSLPRVAEDQSHYGMQIPIESAEPGDLIFYARNGYVYHVSMYIGEGKVIEAAGRKVGIIISGINGNAVWATRVIHD